MTQSVDKFFEHYDRALAAGNFELARALIDTIMNGAPLETNLAGVRGRWRIEAKQVLRRRRAAGNEATIAPGERSAAARKLHSALKRYSAGGGFERDSLPGAAPAAKNARLHLILTESNGHVPAWET